MKSLILIPLKDKIKFFLLAEKGKKELCRGCIDSFRNSDMSQVLPRILRKVKDTHCHVEFAVIRAQYGGAEFDTPVFVNDDVLRRLEAITGEAPLHLPPAIRLAAEFVKSKPEIPLVMVFETAFFVGLPEEEAYYAIDSPATSKLKLRRYGYHGVFHQGAAKLAGNDGASRLISVCLEPTPEITAIINGVPVLTTSGVTPLEGLPGECSSGEIDPFIIITLCKKLGLGPEEINRILTEQSGLAGLVGHTITFPQLFHSQSPEALLARQIIEYRILMACGSGIAVMGGVDAIIFSGRYYFLGHELQTYLTGKLSAATACRIAYLFCIGDLPALLADFSENLIDSRNTA